MVPQQQRRRRRRVVLPRTAERRVVIGRGAGGFGFTIAGQRPCVVSAVAPGGPAEHAGLRAGDALLAVDGASVARAPHASVARLVAAAPGAISLSVAPRETPPTDTEDTEPDERARTRRRHPPPRRRPQAMLHHPACHAAPSTSGVNEILQSLSRAQLTPSHAAQLECRAVVGYLGTIETPQAASPSAPDSVRSAVRKLRQERRPATPVLLSVLPSVLLLRRPTYQVLAQYYRERILYAGCGSDGDRRFFGLVTSAETPEAEASLSCHIFAVDPRTAEHDAHSTRAREFQIACTRDPVAERCLEFPPSAEYVVGVIRGMYSLPPDDCTSPALQQISKLALKGDSPGIGNFSRCNRAVFRPRDRRPCRHEDGQDFVANSPQPSNHSEITTTSSNSDSGIGFHNDCRNIADRILVVDFAGQQPPPNRFRQDVPRRPMGLVGCSSFDAEASFLSNTTPVVDGFGGQGRPLNLDDIILNANDLQPVRHVSPRAEDDNYNYNNVYGNFPSTSRYKGAVYDQVYTENEGHYESVPSEEIDRVTEAFNSVEIYESRNPEYHSNESVENMTVVSGGTSRASMDSVYSSRSHESCRVSRRRHLQASLDDMLVLGLRDDPPKQDKDEGTFLHPASVKCKVRKSIKPLNILSRTRHMLTGKDKKEERRRAMSASAGDVTAAGDAGGAGGDPLPAAASEPDLRDTQSEQSSPFRRWTTGSGAGSSYRHADHRTLYNKSWKRATLQSKFNTSSTAGPQHPARAGSVEQMSEGSGPEASCSGSGGASRGQWPNGGVARWGLGLEQLLSDPVGRAAFTEFLAREFAHENIIFWCSCEEYSQQQDPEKRAELAKRIWERHLSDTASEPVNIDAGALRSTMSRLNENPLPLDLFHEAQRQIFLMMRMDSYQRFLRSGEHAQCARADLRGLPPPPAYSRAAAAGRPTAQDVHLTRSATPPPSNTAGLHFDYGSSPGIPSTSPTIDEEPHVREPRRGEKIPTHPINPTFPASWHQSRSHFLPPGIFPVAAFKNVNFDSYTCRRGIRREEKFPTHPINPTFPASWHQSRPHFLPPGIFPVAAFNNLKKSTSNAADRRRSGGSTLLPWRLRVPSRERSGVDAATDAAPPPAHNAGCGIPSSSAVGTCAAHGASSLPLKDRFPRIQDVVKTGGLCRVVLPDGATSVVGVEASVSVRRLIDRLLQRRNLQADYYDVALRDLPDGHGGTVDGAAPSTVLGGREVVVERRCVVRMELGARCVAVRCRPARRLRHVLRPVLQRYAPQADAATARVLCDGLLLHPETPMVELDGARLQVVLPGEVPPAAPAPPARPACDDDADSLCDLRCHEDVACLNTDYTPGTRAQQCDAGEGSLGIGCSGPRPLAGVLAAVSAGATVQAIETSRSHAASETTTSGPPANAVSAEHSDAASGVDGTCPTSQQPTGLSASMASTRVCPTGATRVCPCGRSSTAGASRNGSGGVCSGGGEGACCCAGAGAPGAGAGGAEGAPLALAGDGGVGRVRAALKPGPSVHTHPPNFLENLREAQQRLQQQGKGEGGAPRTPPPLPPKPPARPPTLV